MTDINITKHYQDSYKSYKAKNPNFVLSLYAGFELMVKDLYKQQANCSLFHLLDASKPGFIAKVASRITERLDINVSYIRAINNQAKHSAYLDHLKEDLKSSPKKVHARYFKEFNHLFEKLNKNYHYNLTYRFPPYKKKVVATTYTIGNKPYYPTLKNTETKPRLTAEEMKQLSAYELFIRKLSPSNQSKTKIYSLQRERIKFVISTAPKRVKSTIFYDEAKQDFYMVKDDKESIFTYLDSNCTLRIFKLKDNKRKFSKKKVLGLFDESNQLIYYTSLHINKMSEYILDIIEAINYN